MEYMLIIGVDESVPTPGPGEPGFDEMMGAWAAYTRGLFERGVFISGGRPFGVWPRKSWRPNGNFSSTAFQS